MLVSSALNSGSQRHRPDLFTAAGCGPQRCASLLTRRPSPLLDVRTRRRLSFLWDGLCHTQGPLARVGWFLPSGAGRPYCVYTVEFRTLRALLKGRCSLLSDTSRQVRMMLRGSRKPSPGKTDFEVTAQGNVRSESQRLPSGPDSPDPGLATGGCSHARSPVDRGGVGSRVSEARCLPSSQRPCEPGSSPPPHPPQGGSPRRGWESCPCPVTRQRQKRPIACRLEGIAARQPHPAPSPCIPCQRMRDARSVRAALGPRSWRWQGQHVGGRGEHVAPMGPTPSRADSLWTGLLARWSRRRRRQLSGPTEGPLQPLRLGRLRGQSPSSHCGMRVVQGLGLAAPPTSPRRRLSGTAAPGAHEVPRGRASPAQTEEHVALIVPSASLLREGSQGGDQGRIWTPRRSELCRPSSVISEKLTTRCDAVCGAEARKQHPRSGCSRACPAQRSHVKRKHRRTRSCPLGQLRVAFYY
ncbi:uncharacterized protein LOC116660765 isoform X2 [Camelus ferus]|uniref:Uncharacterized protein LOC116660765 isoform X2 n=1 Tax=Camelus ferus TaxID=419612 RepID=A0A8B8S984_CAMFR|nr:uncharacterized protein LOC116660765 isoform X2 [Camelus ferus]